MIERATFRNFKALRQIDVKFSRLTVIAGPNASGKSTILEAIHALCGAVHGEVLPPWYLHHLYTRGGKGDLEVQICSEKRRVRLHASPPHGYRPDLGFSHLSSEQIEQWQAVVEFNENRDSWHAVTDSDRNSLIDFTSNLIRFEASRLSAPSHSDLPNPLMSINGEGLASALAFIALNQPDRFFKIQERLRAIVPGLVRIRFDKLAVNKLEQEFINVEGVEVPRNVTRTHIDDVIVFDFAHAADVRAPMVSEGTLVALGLLTFMHRQSKPKMFLVDDLEQGLHPKAQRDLLRILRELMKEDDQLQIIATTHSPYILDDLSSDEVLLANIGPDGMTCCAYLNEHPDFSRWEQEMTAGEFWTVVGENWIKNGISAGQPQ